MQATDKVDGTATIKVPAAFAHDLREAVSRNGMTVVGAFRVHGAQIIELIATDKPRRKRPGGVTSPRG